MNKEHLEHSLRAAIKDSFETFDLGGVGGVSFNGEEFEWCAAEAMIDESALADFIANTEIPAYNYHVLAEEWCKRFFGEACKQAGIEL